MRQAAWGWERRELVGHRAAHGMCNDIAWKESKRHGIRILGLKMQAASCEDWAAWD